MKTLLGMFALVATVSIAHADPVTFDFEGATWTVVSGGNGAPISAIHMTPGFGQVCPQHTVRLDSVPKNKGGRMTSEQKFRGDMRWHVVCVRNAPAAAAVVAPQVQPPAVQQQRSWVPPRGPRILQTGEESL